MVNSLSVCSIKKKTIFIVFYIILCDLGVPHCNFYDIMYIGQNVYNFLV